MHLPTADQPMTLADALAYREQHRWRKIRPASLQAVDALGDEVERLRDVLTDARATAQRTWSEVMDLLTERDGLKVELCRSHVAAPEPPDDYPGKEDGA